jgi:dihydrofolate reductase
MILSIIAAYAKDKDGALVIGKDNKMPWHFPHDLDRFKEYTTDCAIIMGRKTYESIGRILPRRDNIIVTRQTDYVVPGAFVFNDLDEAIQFARLRHSEAFIIGGQQLYEQTLDRADRLYMTSFEIDGIEGDAYFPGYEHVEHKVIYTERGSTEGECFKILENKIQKKELEDEGLHSGGTTTDTAVAPAEDMSYSFYAGDDI